jgi:hypothetical protein
MRQNPGLDVAWHFQQLCMTCPGRRKEQDSGIRYIQDQISLTSSSLHFLISNRRMSGSSLLHSIMCVKCAHIAQGQT